MLETVELRGSLNKIKKKQDARRKKWTSRLLPENKGLLQIDQN